MLATTGTGNYIAPGANESEAGGRKPLVGAVISAPPAGVEGKGTEPMTEEARRRGTLWGILILACVNALIWAAFARL